MAVSLLSVLLGISWEVSHCKHSKIVILLGIYKGGQRDWGSWNADRVSLRDVHKAIRHTVALVNNLNER